MAKSAGRVKVSWPWVSRVRGLIVEQFAADVFPILEPLQLKALLPGKMLRTRLAGRWMEAGLPAERRTVEACCAAVELAHTGSLCHDDVIDAGLIRRAAPTLWRQTGCSAAVLIGDVLVCRAIELVLSVEGGRHVACFLAKVRQTVAAEAEQELLLRNHSIDEPTYLRLARGKTGALFSFAAKVCGGADEALAAALEEAGYRIGTAYQLADDLLDVIGAEAAAGKTLGTDAVRGKFTLAGKDAPGFPATCGHVSELCQSALELLRPWPAAFEAAAAFLAEDFQPLLDAQRLPLDLRAVVTGVP
jgi:octaprenyl-diphosphate synthase